MRRLVLAAVLVLSCADSRFALRPPVLHAGDDSPLAKAPKNDDESDIANAADVMVMRPLSHLFAFEVSHEAINVNALDEVPDSSWFTNRTPAPDELVRGPCTGDLPQPPFIVKATKVGGVTPGVVVHDAKHRKYVLKLDELARFDQPEISTAADAIVTRLYWAVGFNAPCNDVIDVDASDVRVDAKSIETDSLGHHKPLPAARLVAILKQATRTSSGKLRLSASQFIEGVGVGTWRTEGRRHDDPNDVISHEDRRDLRGERLLAAWTAHWDSRGQNTFDSYVGPPRGGHIVHYFLDFSDALGGTITRTKWPEPRAGFESVLSFENIVIDAIGFGFVRRPWDEVRMDMRYPNLGMLDVEHFEPMSFSPQTPLVRWSRATPQDLGWMARKLAHVTVDHIRVATHSGRLSRVDEENRLVEVLVGRRNRILRESFAKTSPLGDITIDRTKMCATDLARKLDLASESTTSYAAELRTGEDQRFATMPPRVARTDDGVCIELPAHFAPPDAKPDSPRRYAIVDWIRFDRRVATRMRTHLYDLGPTRGWALVGIERL